MKITGKMQIDILHRHDLCIAAASRTALEAEARSERWLAERNSDLLALPAERICKPYARRRLSLTGGGRIDRRNQHELSVRTVLYTLPGLKRNLGLILSIELQLILCNAQLLCNLINRLHLSLLRNFHICLHDDPPRI